MSSSTEQQHSIKASIERARPDLSRYDSLYKKIHSNPELSHQEEETAALILQHLKGLSHEFEIRTGVGGHGLIAWLKNGVGKTVMLRADMDALPVAEKTGLDYASQKKQIRPNGDEVPVMHACGHDVHVVCLLVAAETLLTMRKSWSGTVVFLFQPAEETGDGALGMVQDGLFEPDKHACPIPDIVLGQHVAPIRAGLVASRAGPIMSSSDSLKITILGRGGHGSMPHRCIDPIVIASHIVVRLQTIVSRVVSPEEVAVITVGSIHAGEAENVICDRASFTINIRTIKEDTRKVVLEHVKRVIEAECSAGFCEKPPEIEHHMSLPVTENKEAVHDDIRHVLEDYFQQEFLLAPKSSLASEDFSILASSIGRPYYFWLFGGIDQGLWDSLAQVNKLDTLPINHSPDFAPVIYPTLQTGSDALTVVALRALV